MSVKVRGSVVGKVGGTTMGGGGGGAGGGRVRGREEKVICGRRRLEEI